MAEDFDIDTQGATAALEAVGGFETAFAAQSEDDSNTQPEPTPPVGTPDPSATEPAPEATISAEPAADTSFMGDNFDPASLPPEMVPVYKGMQGHFTRETQKVAEQRKQYESLGDPEELREAAQLYQTLQDPNSWPALHKEISEYMQHLGLSPLEAEGAATAQLQAAASPADNEQTLDLTEFESDPDFAPLVQGITSTQTELASIKEYLQRQEEQRQMEALQSAYFSEQNRQETIIRQSNPNYKDEDIQRIYKLVGQDGDLLAAQAQYATWQQEMLSEYLASKQSAATAAPAVLPGADAQGVTVPDVTDLESAHKAAMTRLAEIERAEL